MRTKWNTRLSLLCSDHHSHIDKVGVMDARINGNSEIQLSNLANVCYYLPGKGDTKKVFRVT